MAEHRSAYLIKYTGLPVGDHEFDYEIKDSFFENREGSIILKADVKALVTLHKETNGALKLHLKLDGIVWVECVKCLEEMSLPVEVEKSLLLRLVDKASHEEDDDKTINVDYHAHEIDMEPHIYDFLTLQVPYSPVHPEDENGNPTCNPEVLKYLANQKGKPDTDPANDRWSALRNLKMN